MKQKNIPVDEISLRRMRSGCQTTVAWIPKTPVTGWIAKRTSSSDLGARRILQTQKWRLQRLDAENNPDLKAEICTRPCLAVLAISSLIYLILGFRKMSRTPGWMENVFLLVLWLVLRMKSMKIAEIFWVADFEKKRWKEREEER